MSYELKITREKLEEILEYRQFLQQLRDALDEVLTFALKLSITHIFLNIKFDKRKHLCSGIWRQKNQQ
jgi:hypothetical protein